MQAPRMPQPVMILREVESPAGCLLCVHPGGLPARHYLALADALPNWSVYVAEIGLAPDYWRSDDAAAAVEGVVASILDAARSAMTPASERGAPVVLCGWSFGGTIAHALARRWPQPERIALLAMFDSIAPIPGGDFGDSVGRRRVAARWFVQYFNAQKSGRLRLRWWRGVRDEHSLLSDLLEQSIAQGLVAEGTTLPGFRKIFTSFIEGLLRNGRLAAALPMSTHAGRTVLFRATDGLLRRFFFIRHMGWRRYSPRLTVHSLSSDHYTLLVDSARMREIGSILASELKAPTSNPQDQTTYFTRGIRP